MSKRAYDEAQTQIDRLEDFMFDLWGHEYIVNNAALPIRVWPFILKVKRVRLENVGPIKKLDAEFSQGLNIVYGPGMSGKSILLECLGGVIRREVDRPLKRLKSHGSKEALINLEVFPQLRYGFEKRARLPSTKNSEQLSHSEKAMLVYKAVLVVARPYQAVLLDDPFGVLEDEKRTKLLKLMTESGRQVIATARYVEGAEEAEKKFGANVIRLEGGVR